MIKLILLPIESHLPSLKNILGKVNGQDKICYISLNKTYEYLTSILEFSKKLLIIDAVTLNFITEVPNKKDCIFINPYDLVRELNSTQEKYLEKGEYKHIILDSISTLYAYSFEQVVNDFVLRFVNKLSMTSNLFLLCNKKHFAKISANLEKNGILVIQGKKDEYIVKCPMDTLYSIIEQMEATKNDPKKSEMLYKNAENVYKIIEKDELAKAVKRQIFEKCASMLKA